jgi:hypothetical protein
MNSFPDKIKVSNFSKNALVEERITLYLRKEVYDFLVFRKNNEHYFDLGQFARKYDLNTPIPSTSTDKIIHELKELGWSAKYSFGKTVLFIYETGGTKPLAYISDEADI